MLGRRVNSLSTSWDRQNLSFHRNVSKGEFRSELLGTELSEIKSTQWLNWFHSTKLQAIAHNAPLIQDTQIFEHMSRAEPRCPCLRPQRQSAAEQK